MSNKSLLLTKAAFFNLLGAGKKTKKNKKPASPIFALLFQIALFLYLGILYAQDLISSPYADLPLAFTSVAAFLNFMILFLSLTLAPSILYRFKDGDMLMALPVKKEEILMSKFATFFAYLYMYVFCLFLPSIIIVGTKMDFNAMYYIYGILGLIVLPCIPAVIGTLLSLILLKLTAGKKHAEAFQNIFTVLFVILMVAQPQLIESGKMVDFGFQLNFLIKALLEQDFMSFLIFVALNIVAFIILIKGFAKTIFSVNEMMKTGYHVKNFKVKHTESMGVKKALYKRELKRFFAIFSYVINLALSMFIVLGATVYLAFQKDMVNDLVASASSVVDTSQISQIYLLLLCLMALMCVTTCVSISLEGNKLWVLQTLPLSIKDIFQAKIKTNMTIILVPTILSYTIASFVLFSNPILSYLQGIVLLVVLSYAVSCFGLLINLYFPKLDFDREVEVIKQSASSMFATMGNMILVFLLAYLAKTLLENQTMSFTGIYNLFTLGVIVVAIILHFMLQSIGVKKFQQLSN